MGVKGDLGNHKVTDEATNAKTIIDKAIFFIASTFLTSFLMSL